MKQTVFLTGATGLMGGDVLARLLSLQPRLDAYVLLRRADAWPALAARLGGHATRVTPVLGDITRPGLGIARADRRRLAREATGIIHSAGDVCFSRRLDDSRRVNTDGTSHVLELAESWSHVERFAYVSTAYVVGDRTGTILEGDQDASGWVNAYEQSKHEAELRVRGCSRPWVVFRPSAVVCDSAAGEVRQLNSVHRSLALFHAGLASMLPGDEDSPMDFTTTEYVSDAIARLALRPGLAGHTFHLCAGSGSMPLGEVLDRSYARWARDPSWRRRGISRPALADLQTYRLFESAVEETADARLRRITRALSHFVPQLALAKRFDTSRADAALGHAPPAVATFWDSMIDRLTQTRFGSAMEVAA